MTALEIIKSALRLIEVLAPGEEPTAAEASDALMVLNQMMDSWNAERLMAFTIARNTYLLSSGQQTYTLGPGGSNQLTATRPAQIDRVSIISYNNAQQPLELPIAYLNDQEWQAVPTKQITSSLPQAVWDDQGFPYRTLWYYPIPSQVVGAVIYSWTALNSFAAQVTNNTYPPGYIKAIRYNLAVDLAAEYGSAAKLSPIVQAIAVQSKAIVKSINMPTLFMYCEDAIVSPQGGIFNYLTGESTRSGSGSY